MRRHGRSRTQTVVPAPRSDRSCDPHGTRVATSKTRASNPFVHQPQRSTTMFQKISTFLIAASMLVMFGCNTMAGAGKDIQKGGEKLENSADKNKNK
jgi:predicted small secreted protein